MRPTGAAAQAAAAATQASVAAAVTAATATHRALSGPATAAASSMSPGSAPAAGLMHHGGMFGRTAGGNSHVHVDAMSGIRAALQAVQVWDSLDMQQLT